VYKGVGIWGVERDFGVLAHGGDYPRLHTIPKKIGKSGNSRERKHLKKETQRKNEVGSPGSSDILPSAPTPSVRDR